MQNYRYYAVINANNDKHIFDSSKDYVNYKYKNRCNVNCRGFQDIEAAREYLAEHNYRRHSPVVPLDWEHEAPVFTTPLEPGTSTHADIYIYSRFDRDIGRGAFSAFISSPQYAEVHILSGELPAVADTRYGTSSALGTIVRATRFAYDNGFKSMTVYTTLPQAVHWFNGEWMAKSDSAMEYLRVIDDLVEDKHVKIDFVLLHAQSDDLPNEYFAARNTVQSILQSQEP